MKNTACDIYLGDEELAYQQAFGYIRQLAIHLRNTVTSVITATGGWRDVMVEPVRNGNGRGCDA